METNLGLEKQRQITVEKMSSQVYKILLVSEQDCNSKGAQGVWPSLLHSQKVQHGFRG